MDLRSRKILIAHIEEQKELTAVLYREKAPGWVNYLLRINQLEKTLKDDRDSNAGSNNQGFIGDPGEGK